MVSLSREKLRWAQWMKHQSEKYVKFLQVMKRLLVSHFEVTLETFPSSDLPFRSLMYLAHMASFRNFSRKVLLCVVIVMQLAACVAIPPDPAARNLARSLLDSGLVVLFLVVSFRAAVVLLLTKSSGKVRKWKACVTTVMSQRSPMQGMLALPYQ